MQTEDESEKMTYHQRYHHCQKDDIAENHFSTKAFWSRMNEEIGHFGRDEQQGAIDESLLLQHMQNEHLPGKTLVRPTTNHGRDQTPPITNDPFFQQISSNAVKTLSKACEMFALELTLRACQSKLDGTNTLTEEDVIRALRTSEVHDMFMP